MVVNMENQSPKIDVVLLSIAFAVLVLGLAGQYLFASQPLLFRVVGFLASIGLAVFLVARTRLGQKIWVYWQDSLVELRKVVWPTKQETIHSTIAVLAMVFVMSLVLWSIDAVLVRLMAWIVRLGAA